MNGLEHSSEAVPVAKRLSIHDARELNATYARIKQLTSEDLEREALRTPTDSPLTAATRWLILGLSRSRRGDYQEARKSLVALLRVLPRSESIYFGVRNQLIHTVMRLGEPDHAERMIRDSMSLVSFGAIDVHVRRAFLHCLGRAYRRKGWLSLAAELYRQCMPFFWFSTCGNLLHAELRADRLQTVRGLLDEMEAQASRGLSSMETNVLWSCWLSYCIEQREAGESADYLERLRSHPYSVEPERSMILFQNFEADVLLVQGRFEEAANRYRSALASPGIERFRFDLVPSLARGLAESLHGMGDHLAALEHATCAMKTGARSDRVEELIALRIRGQCQWALGRREAARESFMRAQALHIGREFVRERRRLAASVERLEAFPRGFSIARGPTDAAPAPPRPRRAIARTLELKDGRSFVTLDRELERRLETAAGSDLPVVIEGETGTGKELVARLIHERSARARGPFVVVDCSTLPEALVESELFGAARGAFTGCFETRDGIVARASGGTVLLDELSELSWSAQSKLLRLLQEGTYRRVGEATLRHVDIRCVAALNRPAEELLEQKKLKRDLFHRLNGHRLQLRPLRERRHEIRAIASHISARIGLAGIADEAISLLESAPWEGNVRELEMVLRSSAETVGPGHVLTSSALRSRLHTANDTGNGHSLRAARLAAERSALRELLEAHGGNVSAVARAIGLSRQAVYKALVRTGGREPV